MLVKNKPFLLLFMFIMLSTNLIYSKPYYSFYHIWNGISTMQKYNTKLYYFPADSTNNKSISVIICPGGSYRYLALQHEGFDIAKRLSSQGISCFVLKYRVGLNGYSHPAMIEDLQRAIQFVKDGFEGLNKNNIVGVIGFSAGGHLALMSGAFYKDNYLNKLGIKTNSNLRPDFIAAIYPVVSMQDSIAHKKSRRNLLKHFYTQEYFNKFSIELNIPDDMPPVYISCAKDDKVVKYENSIALSESLSKKHIVNKLQLYNSGGHGYGIIEKRGGEAAQWIYDFETWLKENIILNNISN